VVVRREREDTHGKTAQDRTEQNKTALTQSASRSQAAGSRKTATDFFVAP
jgi:hypothetical protein